MKTLATKAAMAVMIAASNPRSTPTTNDAEAQIWFAEANLEDEEIELGLVVARDKDWLIMPPDRPGKFLITQAGFDAALAGV